MTIEPPLSEVRTGEDAVPGAPSDVSADAAPSPVPRAVAPTIAAARVRAPDTAPASPVGGTDGAGDGRSPSRGGSRPGVEARQVTRVIRRIEPWSVARVAFSFSLALWLILVVASIILWRVASAVGAISHVESFLAQLLADQSFTIDGGQLLRAAAISGVVLVIAGTGFMVLLALLFNLISELTGGLRVRVIEVESARRPRS